MKIALLQCNPVTGDVLGNAERIARAVRRAGNVDLCVTPELALSGVKPGSYLSMNDFVEGCSKALDMLAEEFCDGPALLVGAPVSSVYNPRLLSNAAVLVNRGSWDVISRKVRPAASMDPEARFFDRGVSCGIVTLGGSRLGVVLCEGGASEGFWNVQGTGHNPLDDLIARGVDAVINMAAVPFVMGGRDEAENVLAHAAARHHVNLFFVNAVGGNDGDVYAGGSFFADPTGFVCARANLFTEEELVIDSAHPGTAITRAPEVWEEGVLGALILGTRDFVHKCGLTHAVIGLSGGMDSALVLAIAADALGAENVTAVLMPSPYSSAGSVDDSVKLAKNLGVQYHILAIEPLMKGFRDVLSPALENFPSYPGDFTFENIQARIRGTLVTSLANRAKALVLNTGNKSEGAMGYCTLYGDAVGALGVIADLTKTQVYSVAACYNKSRGKEIIPQEIFDKAPSAELRPGQKDSDSIPPYEELDPVLQAWLDAESRLPVGDLGPRAGEVRSRLFSAEFKRRQEPQPLYVSRKPFGRAWSVPLAGHFRLPQPACVTPAGKD